MHETGSCKCQSYQFDDLYFPFVKIPSTFLIIYRLVRDPDSVEQIMAWLDEQGVSYMHLEGTGWFVKMEEMTAIDLRDNLLHLIGAEDFLFVLQVGPAWSAWNLTGHQMEWLSRNWYPGVPRVG